MTPAPAARQRWNTPRRPQVTGEGQPDAHTDPSREPALDPAPAADVISCSTILDRAEIHLRDGSWAGAQVTGQRQDAGGRLRMLLWWYANPVAGGRAGWFLYDANHVWRLAQGSHPAARPGAGDLGHARPELPAGRSSARPDSARRRAARERGGARPGAVPAHRERSAGRWHKPGESPANAPGFTPLGRRQRLPAGACLGQRH